MNILLIGAPGSGKGTISELLIKNLNFKQLSTGELYRLEITNNTMLGQQAKQYLEVGKYAPDDLTIKIVEQFLSKNNDNLVFDGFPRTLTQAKELKKLCKINKVFHLICSDEIIIKRLSQRIICPTCKKSYHKEFIKPKVKWKCDECHIDLIQRKDDQLEKLPIRLNEYKKMTIPLLDYYSDLIIEIDATKDKYKIFEQIKAEIY